MKTIVERPVDISNEFTYNNQKFRISPTLKQYEVKDYPVKANGKYNDWLNTADMDSVIVIDNVDEVKFLDQDGKDITKFVEQV